MHDSLDAILESLAQPEWGTGDWTDRIRSEIRFAIEFTKLHADEAVEWTGVIGRAVKLVCDRLPLTSPEGMPALVAEAEAIMSPIGKAAKEYTIHCCGHAHIDMNWTWPLVETIATAHDTFSTLNKLMESFPELKFGQSQITIYQMMQKYCPEIYEMIKSRINEGLWQVTAGSWVEGDKNMASGESLCRHALYSKRWLRDNLDMPYDSVKIDWMPDTFGHAWTVPSILSWAGISRYYRCRPENGPWLTWWQGPDGSRILAFRDKGWYNAEINAEVLTRHFIDYEKENGLKDFLWVYGVGDHGGGVTIGHLISARELDSWPVFPNVKLSSIDSYFDAVEPVAGDLPVHDGDFNTVFEGCYTSQSKTKKVNRLAETVIPEAETISLIADALVGFEYRGDQLREAWEHALFNQFHDILAGSSGHDAMEEAGLRFQQIEAITGSIKMRALRRIASQIDTVLALGGRTHQSAPAYAANFGRGAGDVRVPGRISTWSSGMSDVEPLVVFNPLAHSRSEMVVTKIWGRDWPHDRLVAVDDRGNRVPVQVIGTSNDVGHAALNVVFPAKDIPALGYRTFGIQVADEPVKCGGPCVSEQCKMENEFLAVEIDAHSGAIKHLVDKATGYDWVPEGELIGVLELYQEAPHIMTAWDVGQINRQTALVDGGVRIDESDIRDSRDGDSLGMVYSLRHSQSGPNRAAYRTLHMVNGSRVRLEVALSAGSREVEIKVSADWKEIGCPETGVPMLKLALPVNVDEPVFVCEIPFGSQRRPVDGSEIPALRWVDLSNDERGITLANDSKYGYSVDGNTLRATLIRSTYDPDAYPEMGRHDICFTLTPHSGPCDPAAATRASESLNSPMSVVGTDLHDGSLPTNHSFGEVLTPNIVLSALKKAEDSDALVVRCHEVEGKATQARIRLNNLLGRVPTCTETDLLEQPLPESSARIDGDELVVDVPACGIATVMVGV